MSGTTAAVPALTEEQRLANTRLAELQRSFKTMPSRFEATEVGQIEGARGREFGGDCNQLSEMTHSSALIANSLGDSDSAQMLQSLSVGFSQISMGAMALSGGGAAAGAGASSAGSMGALAAAGPYIAIAAGAMVLGSALFGKKKKDDGLAKAFEALFAALQQIGKMVQQVLKNQEMMFGVMQVTLKAVRDLETRVAFGQKQLMAETDFIKTEKLQRKLLMLQEDLSGTSAVAMTKDDKRKALQTLSVWLRQHLRHSSMNQLASSSASPKLAVEILREYQHSPWMMIGFVAAQLKSRLGSVIPDQFLHLPPLPLYMHTARIFLLARARATDIPSDDACASICDTLKAQIAQYQAFIDFLKTTPSVWLAMLDQYEHKRNMVGRAISNADVKNTDDTLGAQVSDEVKRMSLMQSLDELESTRLLLKTTGELVGLSATDDLSIRIAGLESKQAVLELTGKQLHAPRSDYHPAIERREQSAVALALRSGAGIESCKPVNQVVHKMYYYGGTQEAEYMSTLFHLTLHVLGSAMDSPLLNCSRVLTRPRDGGWAQNLPMALFLNDAKYNFALLSIAMGFKPNWLAKGYDGNSLTMGNMPWWVANGDVKNTEAMMIVSATIREEGRLFSNRLCKAFDFYRAMTVGELAKAEMLKSEGIDSYCLLWLVCLLGKWDVFVSLGEPAQYSNTVGEFSFKHESQFRFSRCHAAGMYTTEIDGGSIHCRKTSMTTPLMVAAKHGRADVIEGLIAQHDAGHDIGLATCWSDGSSAATRAFERGFFDIAKHLHDQGAPLSDAHAAELAAKGLAGGPLAVPVREEVAELDALAHRADPSEDEKLLRAMDNLVDVSQDVFRHEIPRVIEAAPRVDVAELALLRAENAQIKAMLAQLLAAQGIAPAVAAPAFAFAPDAMGAQPPAPPEDAEETKEEPVA